MTAIEHNDVADHIVTPEPEHHRTAELVHTPWAGWYYEQSAPVAGVFAA